MKNLLIVTVVILGAIVFYYNSHREKSKELIIDRYGKNFNSERIAKHLPIVEDSWVIRTQDSTYIQWSHASLYNEQDIPKHVWKTVHFKDSVVEWEEDVFNYDQHDSIGDRLIVLFNLKKPDSSKFNFSRHYYRSYPPSKSISVNFEFADSVLRAWGFKDYYLNLRKTKE